MELCDHTAKELTDLLRTRQVSAVEILDSSLKRIQQVDGKPGTLDYGDLTQEDKTEAACFYYGNAGACPQTGRSC